MRTKVVATLIALCAATASGAAPSASAKEKPTKTMYVDCAAAPSGDGSKKSPFDSITAAVPVARAQSESRAVTIRVAEGVCDDESLPIQLDFPVRVEGSRSPAIDDDGYPLNDQKHDTLITWVPPSPVPPSVSSLAFIRVTGSDVRISRLSIDGRIVPGTVTPAREAPAPMGVLAQGALDFEIDHLRIVRVSVAMRALGASGRIRDTYVGTVGGGIVFSGGDPMSPPEVVARNNRVEDYWTGALAVGGAEASGQSIHAVLENNDTVTSYADTGPSNPFGLRISLVKTGATSLEGDIEAIVRSNRFRGSPRYAIIVDGGMIARRDDGRHYTGAVDAAFLDNVIDEVAITKAVSLITFTNSRATELPCERDPAQTRAQCPSLTGNPPQYWEYLEEAWYALRHTGELHQALIDHPQTEPVDGRTLGNMLVLNGEVVDHQTFVPIP